MEETKYIAEFIMQSAERRPLTVDFSDRMPSGATISSCAVTCVNIYSATTDNAKISSTTATLGGSDTTASVFMISPVDGQRYRVSFTATLSDTSILKEDLLITCKDIA